MQAVESLRSGPDSPHPGTWRELRQGLPGELILESPPCPPQEGVQPRWILEASLMALPDDNST